MVITTNEDLWLIDNGCDQSAVSNNCFSVGTQTSTFFTASGAIHSISALQLELVNDVVTCVVMDNGPNILVKLNQCILDTDLNQHESLLQPHQARSFGIIVDDCARCHLGNDGNPNPNPNLTLSCLSAS